MAGSDYGYWVFDAQGHCLTKDKPAFFDTNFGVRITPLKTRMVLSPSEGSPFASEKREFDEAGTREFYPEVVVVTREVPRGLLHTLRRKDSPSIEYMVATLCKGVNPANLRYRGFSAYEVAIFGEMVFGNSATENRWIVEDTLMRETWEHKETHNEDS